MKEQSPPCGADEPGNGHTRSMGSEIRNALAMMHEIENAAAIKLASAFAQAPNRFLLKQEADEPTLRVDIKLLDSPAVVRCYSKLRRASGHTQLIVAPGNAPQFSGRAEPYRGRRPLVRSEDDALCDGLDVSIPANGKQAQASEVRQRPPCSSGSRLCAVKGVTASWA